MIEGMATKRRRGHEPLSADALGLVASVFRILGEPIRIRILEALQPGEKNVSELVEAVGSTQPNVSKHLRILQEAGMVGRRQEGNQVYCFIADASVLELCDTVCASVKTRLSGHKKLAAELNRGISRR